MTVKQAKRILGWHARYGDKNTIQSDHEFMTALCIYLGQRENADKSQFAKIKDLLNAKREILG